MSNSSLINYTKLSPNHYSGRTHAIDTITIHCMAGNLSVEACGNVFASSSRGASSNYGIGSDGRIAMYVEEKNGSWCSSNKANDMRAITIEVANDGGAPLWHVSDKALSSLFRLLADICRRNGIKKLVWSTSKSNRVNHVNGCNMTVHRDYAAKACPGDFLYNNMQWIADETNKLLNPKKEEPKPAPSPIKPSNINTVVHTVKKGENLSVIAKKYNVTVNSIIKENKISNPNKISVGQKLKITKAVEPNYIKKVKVTADWLNFRPAANTNNKPIATIKKGTLLNINKTSNGWGFTTYNGKLGWIDLSFTKKV